MEHKRKVEISLHINCDLVSPVQSTNYVYHHFVWLKNHLVLKCTIFSSLSLLNSDMQKISSQDIKLKQYFVIGLNCLVVRGHF